MILSDSFVFSVVFWTSFYLRYDHPGKNTHEASSFTPLAKLQKISVLPKRPGLPRQLKTHIAFFNVSILGTDL